MSKRWRPINLGDATISYDSIRRPVRASERTPGPYPYYGASGIVDHVEGYLFDRQLLLVSEDGENLRTRKTPIAFLASGRYWVNNHAHVLGAADGYDLRFLCYAMQLVDISGYLSGSTQPKLTAKSLASIEMFAPDLPEQRRIAQVLGAFDSLIDVNQSLIASLDALGRDLASRATDGGKRATIAEITETIEAGRRPRGGVAGISEGVPSAGAESIISLGRWDYGKTKYVPTEFAALMKQGQVQDGDVLVYKDGGKPGDFKPKISMAGEGFPFQNFVINEHVYRVRARPSLGQGFLYFWLQQPEVIAEMRSLGTGAAIPGLNRTAFSSVGVRLPKQETLKMTVSTLNRLATSALSLASECADLTRTRDELLPLLMSGRIHVEDLKGAL